MSLRVTCGNINKENADVYPSKKLYPGSAQKYPSSVKKQAFNERRNVMKHQVFATPIKNASVQKNLFNIVRDQESKKMNTKPDAESNGAATTATTSSSFDSYNFDLIEYFDYDRPCCKQPYQSDEEIWSKMNMMDDSFLNQIIREDGYVSDSGIDDDDILPPLDDNSDNDYENFGNDDIDVGQVFSAYDSVLEFDELDLPKLPTDLNII